MRNYVSPDLEYIKLLSYEDILQSSGEDPDQEEAEMDSDEIF